MYNTFIIVTMANFASDYNANNYVKRNAQTLSTNGRKKTVLTEKIVNNFIHWLKTVFL